MKFKFDPQSIKFRVWLYFILFAAGLMLVLWFLQIFFLNNYYAVMKEEATDRAATLITSDYGTSTNKDFIENAESVSAPNDIYTYFETTDGQDAFPDISWSTKASSTTYSQEIAAARQKLVSPDSKSNDFSFRTKKVDSNNETLIYAAKLSADDKDPIYMYVFSPLYPVDSTITILTNQLVYVTVISLALAFLLSFYLSNRITNPIRAINKSASKLAEGEYGVVFQGGHYTEISNLADTLTRASIELEKSTVLQKDLIANVSHDLKTPLTMVKSYAEMIRDLSGDNPEKRNSHLQVIIDEADRLNLLVGDMLALSRMQSGAMVLERNNFDLKETIHGLLQSYTLLEEQEGYNLTFECKESKIIVHADEERIKQVISNLVNNAVKFCGTDKQVIVTLKRRGNKAICQIIDHGVGIPQSELNHIWERYYKASSNMVRTTKGTGLGLSIVKEILTMHKSKFGVTSKMGHGTTFWFELNAKRERSHD